MSINVLALHGYLQNTEIIQKALEEKLFKAKLASHLNFIYPNAPLNLTTEKGTMSGWWNLASKEMFCLPHEYKDMDKALDAVKQAIEGKKIDAELGFSQGSVLATVYNVLVNQLLRKTIALLWFSSTTD